MNMILALAIVVLCIHVGAIVIWATLYSKVERWIWIMVMLGFTIMVSHRVAEVLRYEIFPSFTHYTALAIAVIACSSVLQTKSWIKKRDRHAEGLKEVKEKLERLKTEVENRDPIASKVAEIITDFRTKIDFYKGQADEHDLPHYEDPPVKPGSVP